MIEQGQQAPDFTLRDQDGQERTLADYAGRKLVLYFYPRADTPGCTTQACGIRDHESDYESVGAEVVGVSPDGADRLRAFADKYSLDYTLLGDPDHATAEAYGVWVEKTNYGKTSMGIQRATFIIDEQGAVAHVIPKASPKTHDEKVLAALREL